MDPAPLDGVVALGGIKYVPTTSAAKKRSSEAVLSDEEQDFADSLVNPVNRLAMMPGQDQSEHMYTPDYQERSMNEDTFAALVPSNSVEDSLFAPNMSSDAAPALIKRASTLSKRGLYTGYVAAGAARAKLTTS